MWGMEICISSKLPGGANVADLGLLLVEPLLFLMLTLQSLLKVIKMEWN